MTTIEVYQPPTAKAFEEKHGLGSPGGLKTFSYGRGIQLIKIAYRTHEKNIKAGEKEPKYSSLRNLYKDVEGRTEKRWSETLSEERIRRDRQYLINMASMLRKELEPVSPELYEAILAKLGVKQVSSTGTSKDFKVTSRIGTRADVLSKLSDAGDDVSTARKVSKALAGKKVSGLGELINYSELREILTSIMSALGLSLSARYDGYTVEEIKSILFHTYD